MDRIVRNYLRAREYVARRGRLINQLTRGQTMTEYALILAAVAIAVYFTYQTMGTDIDVLAQQIDAKLVAASS